MGLFGSLMGLPYMVFFYLIWIAASLARPLLVVTLICLVTSPTAAFQKIRMFVLSVQYLLFCNDKKWAEPKEDPDSFFVAAAGTDTSKKTIERKTVIFLRHGESSWNDTFNKGDRTTVSFIINFIPNLFKAIAIEWFFLITGEANESWFFDSPLSDKGIQQSLSVQQFLRTNPSFATPKEQKLLRLLVGDKSVPAQLVSSNLRRAVSTMLIGFSDRLQQNYPNDNVLVLGELQEISFNPDALSIAAPHQSFLPPYSDPKSIHAFYQSNRVDTKVNMGNKRLPGNGLERMQSFCQTVFETIDKPNVIAAGHSLWFKAFFQTYLPHSCDHVSKKKKLVNGAMCGFVLERVLISEEGGINGSSTANGKAKQWAYRIDPTSLVVLQGGF
jgi:broad specificity phosphatase PhoE